jgi:4-hydroxybenzoate polyprenyltransferase
VPYLRFKERAFIDSITSSAHFVGPLVYGLVLAGNTLSHMPYIVAFFLWGMASHAFGAVQDILPDRKAGISSVATKIGARYTVWFATVAYAISTVLVGLQGGLATVAAIPFIAYVLNTARFWQLTDRTSARANQGWKVFIYTNYGVGFLLTLILIYAKLR